jgi:hypothetical protein
MRIVDERYQLFAGSSYMGAERIRLSKSESATLKRAREILERVREKRAQEFHSRGYGPTLEHSRDLADESDNHRLALGTVWLSEAIDDGGEAGGASLSFDLPHPTSHPDKRIP